MSGSFNVKNPQLKRVLSEKGKDTDEVWSSITVKNGSVQHLDFLDQQEKAVFKTAFEIDQRHLIELAGDRTPYVCQAQSLNIFLKPDVHKKDFAQYHFSAWKKELKAYII